MAANTQIEWAHHSWSPWIGCSRAHTGCLNCYAEAQQGRFGVTWGANGTRRITSESYWKRPFTWHKQAREAGGVFRVFPSLCDPFEDWQGPILDHNGERLFWPHNAVDNPRFVPESHTAGDEPPVMMDDLRCDLFRVIKQTRALDWLLLTKRPQNVEPMMKRAGCFDHGDSRFHGDIWLIYSASDQGSLEAGLDALLKCDPLVPVIGLSLEPLVGPVTLPESARFVDWVIIGGESGRRARPCNAEWIRDLVRQCRELGLKCFVKQLGSNPRCNESWLMNVTDKKGGKLKQWPADLRVQEYPR